MMKNPLAGRPRAFAFALAALTLAACGGNEEAPGPATPVPAPTTQAPPVPAPSPEPVATYDGPPAEVTLSPVGNEMKFAETEFTVHPGQQVHIVLTNTATNPAMTHNVVVLRSEADVNPVGQAAMSASDTDYIPTREQARILAFTPTAAIGATVEVTFTAPSTPGDYPYICTFPGHYMMMRGVMHVVPA